MIGEMLHVYLFHDTASDKIICSISLKILIKCFILTFLCTFISVYKASFSNLVIAAQKKSQCVLSLLLTMPKPVVLTAYFQVTNVDNDLLVCNVSLVYFLFFSQQSIEKPRDRTKSKRKLFTCAQFPRPNTVRTSQATQPFPTNHPRFFQILFIFMQPSDHKVKEKNKNTFL